MSASERPVNKRRAVRKRIREVSRHLFSAKQFAWRTTAAWIWIYTVGLVLGQREHLAAWETSVFSAVSGALIWSGFTPSSLSIFSTCSKLLWLFTICAFSWVQVIGFSIYVLSFPLLVLTRAILRGRLEPYRKTREDSLKKARREGQPVAKRRWELPLLFLLLLWQILYGNTSAPNPLRLAMLLTGLYFCSRLGRALAFAVPVDTPRWGRIDVMIASSRKFISDTIDNAKSGKIPGAKHLKLTIWTSTFILQQLRIASRWTYGKPARRRTAVFVLLRFIASLGALGGISILFWAFAIKYALSPSYLPLSKALLASASRVIPGVPDPSDLHVPATIQVLDSLTAWTVFVLYAGPVASLFPTFQERAITQTAANYARIRSARKSIYRFREVLRLVQKLFTEHPELEGFAKNVVLLRKQGDLRSFLLTQPDFVRSLADKPEEIGLYKSLGVALPDLRGLLCELPPKPIQERPEVDASTARDVAPTDSVARGDSSG
jgi:hypothetical protein